MSLPFSTLTTDSADEFCAWLVDLSVDPTVKDVAMTRYASWIWENNSQGRVVMLSFPGLVKSEDERYSPLSSATVSELVVEDPQAVRVVVTTETAQIELSWVGLDEDVFDAFYLDPEMTSEDIAEYMDEHEDDNEASENDEVVWTKFRENLIKAFDEVEREHKAAKARQDEETEKIRREEADEEVRREEAEADEHLDDDYDDEDLEDDEDDFFEEVCDNMACDIESFRLRGDDARVRVLERAYRKLTGTSI